jgi:hypothetical protein
MPGPPFRHRGDSWTIVREKTRPRLAHGSHGSKESADAALDRDEVELNRNRGLDF